MKFNIRNIYIFFAIFAFVFSINSQESTNSQGTTDNVQKKHIVNFYFKQKFTYSGNSINTNILTLNNNLFFMYSYNINFYTFKILLEDKFSVDFMPLFYKPVNAIDMFYNNFLIEIANDFKIRRIVTISPNISFYIYNQFNGQTLLNITPNIGFSGKYYFGLDWGLTEYFSFDFDPVLKTFSPSIETDTFISYEFFRYYGPQNFKLTIYNNYYFKYSFINVGVNHFFQHGVYLNIYGFYPSIYLTINYENYGLNILEFGVKTGFYYNKNFFSIGLDYTGYKDILSNNSLWENRIDAYVKFQLYKEIKNEKKMKIIKK